MHTEKNTPPRDIIALSHIMSDIYKRATPIFEKYLTRTAEEMARQNFDPLNVNPLYIEFAERLAQNPDRILDIQKEYWQKWTELWQQSASQMFGSHNLNGDGTSNGNKDNPTAKLEKPDRRFQSDDWQQNTIFNFIKQSYLMTCDALENTIKDTEGLDDSKKEKLSFHVKLLMDALSPSNFIMTNPDILRETLCTGGANLVKGLENLTKDLERGAGMLKISTTNHEAFELGRNIATTKGEVIYQNDLMQLIQYTPRTKTVFEKPLLIIPPWINKYYILDLSEENSFIKYAIERGQTVFIISWVNPSAALAEKRFDDYMSEGILESIAKIEEITHQREVNAIGYCLGGTLLAATLAYLAEKGETQKIASATFFTTLLDFEHCGQMKLFLDDEQLEIMDRMMNEKGLFEANQLQQAFSLLRANDLIWSFVVNNYLMGKEPFPFDLLYWNEDSTNMPAHMHSFYLRHMYRDNLLREKGGIKMKNVPIDLRKIETPCYFLSTREDHIAPWRATYEGTQLLSGKKTFTLAASGHVAGVVNPPTRKKYCYWTDQITPPQSEDWLKQSKKHEGSWWPHWLGWIKEYSGKRINAEERIPKNGIEPAPGSYVKVRA